jgi:hypothetical protein
VIARSVILCKAQCEKLLRLPIHKNPRGFIINRNQIRSEPVRAINALNQSGKLIMGDCFLIIFQDRPLWMGAEDSQIVRGVAGREDERPLNGDNCQRYSHLRKMKHPRLDFASFNTMLGEC